MTRGVDAAERESIVFFETAGERHALLLGGLTAIERRVREVAKQGAQRAIVAGAPVAFPRQLPIPVAFVEPGTPPPEGARRERADVVAGIELVDEAARRAAEWKLIRGMNKAHEGPVDALINWRFSMRITRVLAQRSLAITPNQVTVVAILLGLAAAVVASRSGYAAIAIAGVMFELNSILDSVDGELARLRFQYSKLGQWLDNLSDEIVDNAFVVGVAWSLGEIWLGLALGAVGGRLVNALVLYTDVYRRTGTGDVFEFRWWFEKTSASAVELYDPKAITTWLRSLGRRDTYVFVWAIACVAGLPYWVVGHAAVIAAVYLVLLSLHFTVFRNRRRT
ncbi:MAG TPA: CDP-alcohol phosphatidyltransferase family protein [Kofleriaceae bacterium]|nr:CDP-alcohol phosphatidyltransferase family protein [Kofleriaceae bacterium]